MVLIIVNHLQTSLGTNEMVGIAFICCNYIDQAKQTVSNLVSSLLKQMVQHRWAISDNVNSFYQCHRRESTHPTLDQITCVLQSEIRTYPKVFIVVDALDECREDDGTRVRLLLTRGLDINSKDLDGRTPLSFAAQYGHEEVVKLLLVRDDLSVNLTDSIGWAPLFFAARYGHEAVVQLLLARGDIDADLKDFYGCTPLSSAAEHRHEAAVVTLLLARDVSH
jgi:hypothetical protein